MEVELLMLFYAIVSITAALLFYTIGVWSEKLSGTLKPWHVIIFWCGLVFDTLGTTLMNRIATDAAGFGIHGVTGLAAILLMLVHVIWATVVLYQNSPKTKKKFHRFSAAVWLIWLVPFASGMVVGMSA